MVNIQASLNLVEVHLHDPPRPVSFPSEMMMDGITQLSNTGWLVTAAFAALPGHLVGPAHALLLTESLP